MTYVAGGNIQATDYNTFATSATSVNEVFGDLHSGATTIAAGADYGYGQTPVLTSVSANTNVLATEWSSLFSAMRACGTHQGTSVVPPVPASGPVSGDVIAALNSPSSMASAISSLRTNRLNLALGQSTVIAGTNVLNNVTWSTSLTYTFRVDFGSWNNARYFFNSGGKISINAAYLTPSTPEETGWQTLFADNFPVNMNWQTTVGQGSNVIVNPAGFYLSAPYPGLTTSYQSVYQKYEAGGGGGYYLTNYVLIQSKLTNAAGTNGQIDFTITLINGDTFPDLKPINRVQYNIGRIQTSGAITYPGTFTVTSLGFTSA